MGGGVNIGVNTDVLKADFHADDGAEAVVAQHIEAAAGAHTHDGSLTGGKFGQGGNAGIEVSHQLVYLVLQTKHGGDGSGILPHALHDPKLGTLMPIPVHRMASKRGSREMMKISSCSKLPARSSPGVRSITPTNSEQQDKTSNRAKRTMVERYGLIQSSPFFMRLAIANYFAKKDAQRRLHLPCITHCASWAYYSTWS